MTQLINKFKDFSFHTVVAFDTRCDKVSTLNLTVENTDLTENVFNDVIRFSNWIDHLRAKQNAKYLLGGYNELRKIYSRSELFGSSGYGEKGESRRLHIGTDIWGLEGTKVFVPFEGKVHSFAFNNQYGDYGATIVLQHFVEGVTFYTLYGHLSNSDLQVIAIDDVVRAGSHIGHFGNFRENGGWPPHLHFQVIQDMEGMKGDYPGVCRYSERMKYLDNCPDPDFILQMNRYL